MPGYPGQIQRIIAPLFLIVVRQHGIVAMNGNMIARRQSQFAAADIKVLTSLAPDLPSASASLEHLQSVWLNLLINARDALLNVRGERRVEVISKFAVSSDEILVAVRDTGYGMSPAELDHIFEPFFTTKDPGQGTGLGLATCHRIIEQHGGSIDVLSSPGKGTTFVVRLPLPRQAELV